MISIANLSNEPNVIGRYKLWNELTPYLNENFYGYGMGSIGAATYSYGSLIGGRRVADNQYLSIVLQHGIVGFGLFVLIILASIHAGIHAAKRGLLGAATILLYVTTLMVGAEIGSPPLCAFPGNMLFWALLGGASSLVSRGIGGGAGRCMWYKKA